MEMVKAGLLECALARNASLFSHRSAILDSKAWGSLALANEVIFLF